MHKTLVTDVFIIRSVLATQRGVMVAVNSSRDLTSTVGDFLKSFNWTTSNKPYISRPFHDTASRGGSTSHGQLVIMV